MFPGPVLARNSIGELDKQLQPTLTQRDTAVWLPQSDPQNFWTVYRRSGAGGEDAEFGGTAFGVEHPFGCACRST